MANKHIKTYMTAFSSAQFSSVAQSCPTLCDPMNRSTPGLSVHHQLPRSSLRLTSIESVMPSSHLILCRPLFLLPPIPPSIRVFSNESALRMRWPKYQSFSFSIILSKEHTGLSRFSRVQFCAIPWTVAFKAPLSMGFIGFPRQENWSGLPFPSSGGLPDTGMEPASFASPVLAGGFFITAPPAVQVCCPFSSQSIICS